MGPLAGDTATLPRGDTKGSRPFAEMFGISISGIARTVTSPAPTKVLGPCFATLDGPSEYPACCELESLCFVEALVALGVERVSSSGPAPEAIATKQPWLSDY